MKNSKLFYFIFVFIFSYEFLFSLILFVIYLFFKAEINAAISAVKFNTDLIKYLIVLPVGVFAWVLKEVKDIVVAEKDNIKVLINWPDYWRLKCHLQVSILYGVIFCCASIAPWLRDQAIYDAFGIVVFLNSLLGILIVATSVYFAQISLKEEFNRD